MTSARGGRPRGLLLVPFIGVDMDGVLRLRFSELVFAAFVGVFDDADNSLVAATGVDAPYVIT